MGVHLQIKFSLVLTGVVILMGIENGGQSYATRTKILKMPMTMMERMKVGMTMTILMMMLMMTSWK